MKPSLAVFTSVDIQGRSPKSKAVRFRVLRTNGYSVGLQTNIARACALLLALSFVRTVQATSIVVFRTLQAIVVAADSKERWHTVGASLNQPTPSVSVCKIRQSGNFFVASAGVAATSSPSLDVKETAANALRGQGTIPERIDRFEEILLPALTATLESVRLRDIDLFVENAVRTPPLSVIFFGREHNAMVVYARTFMLVSAPEDPVRLSIKRLKCPSPDCPSSRGVNTIVMGEQSAILKHLATQTISGDLVTTAASLVKLAIDSAPERVGPPIDVLLVEMTGSRWIRHKAECPEIKSATPQPTKRSPRR